MSVFALALVVAALSGVATKRAGFGPAFVAVEPVGVDPIATVVPDQKDQIFPMIAATLEPTVAPVPVAPSAETVAIAPAIPDGVIGMVEPSEGHARYFNGRPIRPARTIMMTVTAYSPDEKSCGKFADGITASLKSVWTNGMRMAAADTRMLPFGTLISVPGYAGGEVVPVLDRGGAIKGNRLDMLYPTHEIALKWGVRRLPVVVWEYADTPAR